MIFNDIVQQLVLESIRRSIVDVQTTCGTKWIEYIFEEKDRKTIKYPAILRRDGGLLGGNLLLCRCRIRSGNANALRKGARLTGFRQCL